MSMMSQFIAKILGTNPVHRTGKHKTSQHRGYEFGFHNRAGTKLVRKWYGEEAARRFNV